MLAQSFVPCVWRRNAEGWEGMGGGSSDRTGSGLVSSLYSKAQQGFPCPGPVYRECVRLRTTHQGQREGKRAGGQGKLLQTPGGTLLPRARSPLPSLAQTLAGSGCLTFPVLGISSPEASPTAPLPRCDG